MMMMTTMTTSTFTAVMMTTETTLSMNKIDVDDLFHFFFNRIGFTLDKLLLSAVLKKDHK